MPAISFLEYHDVISRRYRKELLKSGDYYYDEPTLTLTKKSDDEDFPSQGMDLSDAWVVAVVRSVLIAQVQPSFSTIIGQ